MARNVESHPNRLELPKAPCSEQGPVLAWRQPVELATYLPAAPDRNPMFLETRVYQGSSGRVYPLPFIDRIAEQSVIRAWDAIHLENEYLRLMILPEIGGRIHVGLDKTNGYDFFYRQNVIKPALVGLAGPWISGGVEFNWPQHHRPGTFLPMETEIERHADGSVTVWCSDHDPLQRMKGMHGICLHPSKAVVEVKVRLYNRTPYTQTFLWWANMATRVHEQYQSFFPPDVRFVADHAKRAITSFPHSDRPYYGVDYPARARDGVPEEDMPKQFRPDGSYSADDLSWYANIPVPTSYMITSSKEDFFGGYDHRARAGVLHFADHRIAPGKKQWTWGNHDFGYAWDRSLTEDDGPYIELMAGVYTDNQPDFSFLAPGETKKFSQYWYPLQQIGPPKAASLDCALNVTVSGDSVVVGVQSTAILRDVTVTLLLQGRVAKEWLGHISPGRPIELLQHVTGGVADDDVEVTIFQSEKLLLRFAPRDVIDAPVPVVAREPPLPEQIASNDELFLTGLHLSQYRHATRDAAPYWREAILRDPGDARANTALGQWHLRRGEFAEAEKCLHVAIARLTHLNPNPNDGEAFYLLGLALRFQGRSEESYDAFAKAAWSDSWKGPANFALAQADATCGDVAKAYGYVERSLSSNTENLNARSLAVILLRQLQRPEDAAALLQATQALDPLDDWSRYLASGVIPKDNHALLDLAWDYAACGSYETAIELLRNAQLKAADGTVPLVLYTQGYFLRLAGQEPLAEQVWQSAALSAPDYCFPHRLEDIQVFDAVLLANPLDARAAYFLGNLLYNRRRHDEAIQLWQQAAQLEPTFPTVHRNLGIALFNVRGDREAALAEFDAAFKADPADGRILYERDQLWKRVGIDPQKRLRELLNHVDLVAQRDDLSVELATLYNQTGKPEAALELLLARKFQPWEGGEGLVLAQFTRARMLLAKEAIAADSSEEAIEHLRFTLDPPASLGEARHLLANKSDLEYWLGVAYAAAGNKSEAEKWWQRAARQAGDFQQMSVLAVSDMTFWRGMALEKLGRTVLARKVFSSIAAYAAQLEKAEPKVDYFATSLPTMLLFHEDLHHRNRVLTSFLQAQATYGLHGHDAAHPLLQTVLDLDLNHAAASDLQQQVAFERAEVLAEKEG